ncbi:hypothetical protein GCM10023321_59700 [Pseudonocardia eucalypti]|uniref:Cyclodeaminase/cyclohydrolase domain-containing protein n=1 Tax=Pseudonocardia eucalypti TaxID=648755 RepID=A0ABP9QTQ8_9PSEU|nr:formiminotetrahydrofolate cyclodeaminase [Pseudonocardia eucalypti]
MSESYSERTVAGFLEELAARRPAPSGGAAAALTVATAAALAAMAARFARAEELIALAGPADELRARALRLADADAVAYADVLAARDPERKRAALRAAAAVPLDIAAAGAQVAELAARLATQGNRNLVGDARTALLLAGAATRSAAELVEINVGPTDPLATAARRHADTATQA